MKNYCKIGDNVKCLNNYGGYQVKLKVGKIYRVLNYFIGEAGSHYITVMGEEGQPTDCYWHRFVLMPYIPFYLRGEYRDYVESCQSEGLPANSFRDWFDVYYHYEMEDNK